MTKLQKTYKRLAKKLPCFTCIIRVPCGNIKEGAPSESCDKYKSWLRVRNMVVGRSLRNYETWNSIMKQISGECTGGD